MPEEIRGFADSKERSDQNYSRVQEKKKKIDRDTFRFSLSLSLCRELFALSSRFISTALHAMPLAPKDTVSNV